MSMLFQVNCGVQQGWMLSPLLFFCMRRWYFV